MTPLQTPPRVGDRIPPFSLPANTAASLGMNQFVGKPLILIFYGTDSEGGLAQQMAAFRDSHRSFQDLGVQVAAIGTESIGEQRAFADQHSLPFPLLHDPQGRMATFHGVSGPGIRKILLIAPSTHIWAVFEGPVENMLPERVLAEAKAQLQKEAPRMIIQQAPVLLVPEAITSEIQQRLLDAWEHEGNEEYGHISIVDGKPVRKLDYGHKIRRDHFLKPGGELDAMVKACLSRRLLQEVNFAFHFSITRSEGLRVGCYDAGRGGYFRMHRDNSTPATAHRRFAMSLLLNDDYEGGYLRFPEYGPHLYRPPARGAIVFSCSLMHEATDVTAGRRFVLLDFFYGENEVAIREANLRQFGETGQAGPAQQPAQRPQ